MKKYQCKVRIVEEYTVLVDAEDLQEADDQVFKLSSEDIRLQGEFDYELIKIPELGEEVGFYNED